MICNSSRRKFALNRLHERYSVIEYFALQNNNVNTYSSELDDYNHKKTGKTLQGHKTSP